MKQYQNPAFIRKALTIIALYVITISIIVASIVFTPKALPGFWALHLIIVVFASVLLSKYLFYMIVSPWHSVWTARNRSVWKDRRPDYNPLVSAIIPAWNEEVGIIHTIESLVNNSYANLEIVVVNDGSTDKSDEIIRAYVQEFEQSAAAKEGKRITYVYQGNGGKGSALNRGVELANGEIIVSIDADCFVAANAIQNFVSHFRNPQVMAAVGNVKVGNTRTLIGLIQYMEFLFSFYFKKADSLMNTIYIIGGAAGAFRREVFTQLGGYTTSNITEDIELSMRIQNAGMRIVYADDAVVYTEGASDLEGLKSQRLRWKRGRFETFSEYLHMFFSMRKGHNKVLTFLILPLAIFSEFQLFFEGWFLLYLYVYALITHDFTAFVSGIIVVSAMFVVQVLFEDKETRTASFVILAPVAWLLFYLMTYVETSALIKSVWGLARKTELTWQRWSRVGLVEGV